MAEEPGAPAPPRGRARRRRSLARPLGVLGTLLILCALGFAGFNLVGTWRAGVVSERLVAAVHESAARTAKLDLTPDYELDPAVPMPWVEAEGERAVGVLSVPALSLEVPVLAAEGARGVPYLFAGSVYAHDAVIAGGNGAAQLGRLTELEPGEALTFTDVDGNTFSYTVAVHEVIDPADRADMLGGGFDLTLFTSTVGGEMRDTIRCDLAS